MSHIHKKPGQHDHTASTFLFRTDFSEPKVMLHFHQKLGSYMQFGGHVELNETPWQTVIHELREESGYDIDQLQILQPKQRLKASAVRLSILSQLAIQPIQLALTISIPIAPTRW
jgi:8-oxo-dGTP pyrophosphatase MutT (NUDIX family)